MDAELRKLFQAHVRKLRDQALVRPRDERGMDAVRSLACMALIIEGDYDPPPGDEADDGLVVDFAVWRDQMAVAA